MKKEELKELIIQMLPTEKKNAVQMTKLADLLNITTWELKDLISELRLDYPICSKTREGGGYWISSKEQEILDFITDIETRRNSHNKTIAVMTEHLKN